MTKKSVLVISGLGSLVCFLFLFGLLYDACGVYWDFCKKSYDLVAYVTFPILFVFFLSLITYKLPEQVFQYWWKFAVWFVPVVIAITTWFDTRHTGGSWGMPDLTTAFVHIPLYIIFIGVSLVRIGIAWREVKTGQPISLMKKAALIAAVPVLTYGTLWLMV